MNFSFSVYKLSDRVLLHGTTLQTVLIVNLLLHFSFNLFQGCMNELLLLRIFLNKETIIEMLSQSQ